MNFDIVSVLGCARSGSTMLEGILQRMAHVTALGEVTYVWSKGFLRNELCGCGANFSKCVFWTEVLRDAFGKVSPDDAHRYDEAFKSAAGGVLDVGTTFGRPPPVDPMFRDISRALYTAAYKVGGEKTLLDSSKTTRYAASLQAAEVGRVLPIHIFRGASPNVWSLRTAKRRPQSQDATSSTMARSKTLFHAIAHWSLRNEQASQFVAKHKGPKETVSYQRFCAAVDAQLGAIIKNLGLTPKLSGEVEGWHSVAGNPMRFGSDALQIREDDRWQSGLNDLEKGIIRLLTSTQQKSMDRRALDVV